MQIGIAQIHEFCVWKVKRHLQTMTTNWRWALPLAPIHRLSFNSARSYSGISWIIVVVIVMLSDEMSPVCRSSIGIVVWCLWIVIKLRLEWSCSESTRVANLSALWALSCEPICALKHKRPLAEKHSSSAAAHNWITVCVNDLDLWALHNYNAVFASANPIFLPNMVEHSLKQCDRNWLISHLSCHFTKVQNGNDNNNNNCKWWQRWNCAC